MTPQPGRKRAALRPCGLAGLIFRPAVEIGIAEPRRVALLLARQPVSAVPRPVVGSHQFRQRRAVVAIAVHRHGRRQAQADMALDRRPADGQPGHREHLVGQTQNLADTIDMVADHADRAAAEPCRLGREDG